MSRFDFEIKGGRELEDALRRLGPDLERKVAKGAARAGANVIAKEAIRLAPEDDGTLKRSIKVVTRSQRVGDAVVSIVTRAGKRWQSKGMDAWYAGLIEFGTKFRPATPFLRPAMDSKAPEALKAISAYIQKRIGKLAKG